MKQVGFQSFNRFIDEIKNLKQIYDITFHLYLEERGRLKTKLPIKYVESLRTSIGETTHSVKSLYNNLIYKYPYKLRQLLLISSVTALEVYLTECIKEIFERDITPFEDESKAEFQRNYLFNQPSIKLLLSTIMEKDVRNLTSGGLDQTKKYYLKKFNINFDNIEFIYRDIEEIHIIRHLFVHRNGICDYEYTHKFPTNGYKVGDKIQIEHQFFIASLDKLKQFGIILNKQVLRQFPDSLRKPVYFHGDAVIKTNFKKLLLEISIIKKNYDLPNFLLDLKVKNFEFKNYIVQITVSEKTGFVVISGLDEQLSIFFRQIKINENIHLNNVIDLLI